MKKKSIKIVTFSGAHNYGALLQCFALMTFLKKNNYDAVVADYKFKPIEEKYKIISLDTSLKIIIEKFLKLLLHPKNIIKRNIKFKKFINNNIAKTVPVYNLKDFSKILNKEDILITGSDQVWNPAITNGLDDIYTLNVDCKCKKISYAASVGSIKYIEKNKEDFIRKLSKLDLISVREREAEVELEKILNNKITTVIDPTMLLTKQDWQEKIDKENKAKDKYILAYLLEKNEEFIKIVNYLCEKTGLKVIHLGATNPGYKYVKKNMNTADPFDFLELINNSEFVVTTSFHATVFSILLNKKFWVIPHKITGARVKELLKMLNISDREVDTFNEFKNKDYDKKIDYADVNKKLDIEREKSANWLKDAIEK